MRIVFMIYGSIETLTGGYLYDRHVVEHLRARGHDVTVVSQRGGSYLHALADNVSRAVLARVCAAAPDVVVQDELNHPSLVVFNRILRRRRPVPIVAVVHALRCLAHPGPPARPLARAVERAYLRGVDGHIGVSRRTLDQVARLVGARRPGTIAYPAGDRFGGGLDAEEVAARAAAPGPLRALYTGNLSPNKQLHRVLEALAELPGVHLTVVGDPAFGGEYARAIHRQIRELRLGDRVDWAGRVGDPATLASHYRRAHVLVLPSRAEGFPLVIPEAAGFGVPAIATRNSAAAEFIDHGSSGFVVDPDDPRAIGRHLRQLHDAREDLRAISLAALDRFRDHPRWRDTGDTVHRFLTGVAATSPSGARGDSPASRAPG